MCTLKMCCVLVSPLCCECPLWIEECLSAGALGKSFGQGHITAADGEASHSGGRWDRAVPKPRPQEGKQQQSGDRDSSLPIHGVLPSLSARLIHPVLPDPPEHTHTHTHAHEHACTPHTYMHTHTQPHHFSCRASLMHMDLASAILFPTWVA